MKTKIATALSLIGVLGAGSAAALVNTEILDSGPSASTSSALVEPSEATSVDGALLDQVNAAMQGVAIGGETSNDSSRSATASAATAPASSPPTTFDVGDAGSVTVEVRDGRLTIVSAAAVDGWTVTKTEENEGGDEIEVYFETATVRVEFGARLVDGEIVPSVDATALGSAPAPAPAAPALPTAPVIDDHDDMDTDDHDDMDTDDHDDMDTDDHDERETDDHGDGGEAERDDD